MPQSREPLEHHAGSFKALGHPIRLAILRLIVQGPEAGTPAGEIRQQVYLWQDCCSGCCAPA